jgi:hypothetical protein
MEVAGRGLFPTAIVLETIGRRTGHVTRVPLAVARYRGQRFEDVAADYPVFRVEPLRSWTGHA